MADGLHDKDLRNCLHKALLAKEPKGSILLHELGITQGSVRIDLAVVNDHFSGYEIKSETDTLTRLSRQITAYSKVLDFASVVTSPNHLDQVQAKVPSWWGIYRVSGDPKSLVLDVIRSPDPNPCVDTRALVELLWHEDTLKLLEERNALRGVRGKRRRFAWDRLVEVLTTEEIRKAVFAKLKRRRRGATRV